MPLIAFPSPARRPRPHQKPRDSATPLTLIRYPATPDALFVALVYTLSTESRVSYVRLVATATPRLPVRRPTLVLLPVLEELVEHLRACATTSAHSPVASRNNLKSYKEVQEDGQGAP